MDKRSARIVELLAKLQEAVGRGDVCAPHVIGDGSEPDVVLTIEAKSTGQVIRFNLWRAEIEQWRGFDPLTKTPVAGPSHLKILGDVASMEQVSPPKEEPKQ